MRIADGASVASKNTKSFPEPVIFLLAIGTAGVVLSTNKQVTLADLLSGYSDPTAWLVFSAFFIGTAFAITGLGKRIAYQLIRAMGGTPTRLGYARSDSGESTSTIWRTVFPSIVPSSANVGLVIVPIWSSRGVPFARPSMRGASRPVVMRAIKSCAKNWRSPHSIRGKAAPEIGDGHPRGAARRSYCDTP